LNVKIAPLYWISKAAFINRYDLNLFGKVSSGQKLGFFDSELLIAVNPI